MLILSHRGYHPDNSPENTLEAFDRSREMGIDGIETDIRLSADGMLVLFHDRLTPDKREVASLTAQELSEVVGYSVPTLEHVLALDRFKDILWNLEIKIPTAVKETISVVNHYIETRRFLITSFWHSIVLQCSQSLNVDCGLLIAHQPLSLDSLLQTLPIRGHVNTIVWNYETLDDVLLQKSVYHGLKNFVYGVETEIDHQRLADMPLYGVITDHPNFLL